MLTPCADHDAIRPMHLAEEVDLEPCDYELGIDRQRDAARIVQQLHARVLAADGEHGIRDVPVAIGVSEAQFFRRVHGIVLETRSCARAVLPAADARDVSSSGPDVRALGQARGAGSACRVR